MYDIDPKQTTANSENKKSKLERMSAGEWCGGEADAEQSAAFWRAKDLAWEFNQTRPSDKEKCRQILTELLGELGEGSAAVSPFHVDYGFNIKIGPHSFINHGAYLMDCAPITFGAHSCVGPQFKAYTVQHPLDAEERNAWYERALPITVGDNCWFGGNVTVLPGVTIGNNCVIGANSLVTKDIPDNSLAVGSPAKVVRQITEADKLGLKELLG